MPQRFTATRMTFQGISQTLLGCTVMCWASKAIWWNFPHLRFIRLFASNKCVQHVDLDFFPVFRVPMPKREEWRMKLFCLDIMSKELVSMKPDPRPRVSHFLPSKLAIYSDNISFEWSIRRRSRFPQSTLINSRLLGAAFFSGLKWNVTLCNHEMKTFPLFSLSRFASDCG